MIHQSRLIGRNHSYTPSMTDLQREAAAARFESDTASRWELLAFKVGIWLGIVMCVAFITGRALG